jgi:hypothetical protein
MAPPTSSSLRLALRASLLGGCVLDSVLGLAVLAAAWGFVPGPSNPTGVSYPWLLAPALFGRAGIQALACYDRRRYDGAIPWLALTLALSGLLAGFGEPTSRGLAAAYGLLGLLQLIAWRWTRA